METLPQVNDRVRLESGYVGRVTRVDKEKRTAVVVVYERQDKEYPVHTLEPSSLADETVMFVAIVPNGWGKGMTPSEAVSKAKKAVGIAVKPGYAVVYEFPIKHYDSVWVDGMGTLHGVGLRKVQDTRARSAHNNKKAID